MESRGELSEVQISKRKASKKERRVAIGEGRAEMSEGITLAACSVFENTDAHTKKKKHSLFNFWLNGSFMFVCLFTCPFGFFFFSLSLFWSDRIKTTLCLFC